MGFCSDCKEASLERLAHTLEPSYDPTALNEGEALWRVLGRLYPDWEVRFVPTRVWKEDRKTREWAQVYRAERKITHVLVEGKWVEWPQHKHEWVELPEE